MKHIPDGGDFEFPTEFGFHGGHDVANLGKHRSKNTENSRGDHESHLVHKGPERNVYAHGGEVHHTHPHGHHVVHAETLHDGSVMHHHAHGGYSHHHPDGTVTHHHSHGALAEGPDMSHVEPGHEESDHFAHGGEVGGHHKMSSVHTHPHGHEVTHVSHGHDGSEIHHHSHGGYTIHHSAGGVSHHDREGFSPEMQTLEHSQAYKHGGRAEHEGHGDLEQDKSMIKKAFRQHDQHEHGGAKEEIALARGGMPRPSFGTKQPRSTPTPRNARPAGGQVPYGEEPSAEPDVAGSDQGGMQGLKHGGRPRRRGEC